MKLPYININQALYLPLFGVLTSLILRLATSLHPYSGQNSPPIYGDYEAQRHWMEITTNVPITQWYHNTTQNDLMYWGLDYPPLTAYHMYLCGKVAQWWDEKWVALGESRGWEGADHKLFMRSSVLLGDILVYLPALVGWFVVIDNKRDNKLEIGANGTISGSTDLTGTGANRKKKLNKSNNKKPSSNRNIYSLILALLYPGVILIDHGHFQYNSISLGLLILATTSLIGKRELWASFFFTLSLNYKQMELYHALPFFSYLLSSCIPKPGEKYSVGLFRLLKISLVVLGCFVVIWAPFLQDFDGFLQVVHRLFPVARGIFEDKVSNVWCALNIIYKFKFVENTKMVRYCIVATLAAVLPSCADLFLRPNVKKFVPALINTSLGFFLFSFQVHEKAILLCAIPVLLYLPQDPFACFWFLHISSFSMLPLLEKDGLLLAYISLNGIFITVAQVCYNNCFKNIKSDSTIYAYYRGVVSIVTSLGCTKKMYSDLINLTSKHLVRNTDVIKSLFLYLTLLNSLLGSFILGLLLVTQPAPARYPHLYPLLVSIYSCIHLVGFCIYFNIVQFRIPQGFDDDDVKEIKFKTQ